jgi:hypothetical protein
MEGVISTASFLLDSAKAMNVPVVVTEQYPRGLGHTVPDLDVSGLDVISKTKFSMFVPEVEECFTKAKLPVAGAHVVLFGIEVRIAPSSQTNITCLIKLCIHNVCFLELIPKCIYLWFSRSTFNLATKVSAPAHGDQFHM